jgi:hypothetical protein
VSGGFSANRWSIDRLPADECFLRPQWKASGKDSVSCRNVQPGRQYECPPRRVIADIPEVFPGESSHQPWPMVGARFAHKLFSPVCKLNRAYLEAAKIKIGRTIPSVPPNVGQSWVFSAGRLPGIGKSNGRRPTAAVYAPHPLDELAEATKSTTHDRGRRSR